MKSASIVGGAGGRGISERPANILTVAFERVWRSSDRVGVEPAPHEPERIVSFGKLFAELQREGESSARLECLAYGILAGSLLLFGIIRVM